MSNDAMKITLSGMNDATLRVATAAQNIANASTTGRLPVAQEAPAKVQPPQDVVTVSPRVGANNPVVATPAETPAEATSVYVPQDVVTTSQSVGSTNLGVTSTTVPREPAYAPMADPTSPLANEQGLVAAPNVDLTTEIISAQTAAAAYHANASIIRTVSENEKNLIAAVSA